MRHCDVKWIGAGLAGVICSASAAVAADVAVPVLQAAEPPPPVEQALVGDWQGLYFGAHANFGLSNYEIGIIDEGYEVFTFDGIGGGQFSAGVLAGFDHRVGQRWVAGLEVDGAFGSGGPSLDVIVDPIAEGSAWIDTDWAASARARVGYLTAPETLFYVSVGATVAHAVYGFEVDYDPFSEGDEEDETLYGLILAAIGAETYVTPKLRIRYEYLTSFLHPPSFGIDDVELKVTPLSGAARVAAIVDLGGPNHANGHADMFGYAPDSWTGFHLGGAVGHSMADTRYEYDDDSVFVAFDGFGGDGFVGGVFGGFDIQAGPWLVMGVEGGYYWTNVATETVYDGGFGMASVSHDSFYDIRGRVGLITGPSTMIYGVIGWAHAEGTVYAAYDGDVYADESFGRDGIEFGGGIETWLAQNVTLRAEYTRTVFDDVHDLLPPEYGHLTTTVGNATLAAVFHLG